MEKTIRRVQTRWWINEENNEGICLSLPVKIVGNSREDVCEKAVQAATKAANAYLDAGKRVPWEDPRENKVDTDYPVDGGNQSIWIDVPVEADNLPFGEKTVHCLRCDRELQAELFDHEGAMRVGMLYGGAFFTSNGNYGSTVLDMDGGDITIFICDDCLKERGDKIFYREPKGLYKTFSEHRKELKEKYSGPPAITLPKTPGMGLR